MHISKVKVGDYIFTKHYHHTLNGEIVFYSKKYYRITHADNQNSIYIFCIDSEVGAYQLQFNLNNLQRIDYNFSFASLSEERMNKIKTFYTE